MTLHSDKINTLLGKLESARQDFMHLLEAIPADDWEKVGTEQGWTLKQEMVHIVQVLEIIPKGIARARRGGKRSPLSMIPSGVRGWINGRILVPLKARQHTRESIRLAYDSAHTDFVSLVARLSEADMNKGMPYPRQFRTVEQLAYRPVEHFREHEAHIRRILG